MVQQTLVGQGLSVVKTRRSLPDTLHYVGLLWTSDQTDTQTSTWQRTTLTTDRYPCHRWESNPQSQKASGHRPTS